MRICSVADFMAKLVLFDIDGTLVHTGGVGRSAFARTFEAEFNAYDGVKKVNFAGRTDKSLARELFDIHRIPATPDNFHRFFERYVFWLDYLITRGNGAACHGVREFIHELRSLPNPPMLGLLTGNIRLGAEIKLRHYGLWDTFHLGGFADDHEDRNHIAVAAYERGRRSIGKNLKPEDVIVVGDTHFDVMCGRFIGAKVLAVATGGAKYDELKEHNPTWLVENLSQIRAKDIVKS